MKKSNLKLTVIALAIADFLGAIDATGVNVALPQITKDLKIPIAISQWIPNAYTLALVSLLILMGKLGDKIGPKRLYLWGLAVFGISSLFLSFIDRPAWLIALRAIQGISTAILYTMPMAIIAHLWKEREKAFAVTATFFAVGMLVGPVVGGLLAELKIGSYYGWHFLFLINIPIVIVGLIISIKSIPHIPSNQKMEINYFSALLLLAGVAIVALSLSSQNQMYSLLGVVPVIALYLYQGRIKLSLLDFDLFKNRTFSAANAVSFFQMVSLIGMSFILTFFFQDVVGWNPAKAGLALLPIPVVTAIFSGLGSQIKSWRFGAILSSFFVVIGLALLPRISSSSPYWSGVFPGLFFVSAGAGILMTSIFAAILGSASVDKYGSASGLLNTIQQFGALVGIALVSGMVLNYRAAFNLLLAISFLSLVAACFVRDQAKQRAVG